MEPAMVGLKFLKIFSRHEAGKSPAFPERIKQFSENGKFDLRRGGNYENQQQGFRGI
ncbi:hypothetical protein QCO44_05525 [Selenomonas sputigena]|uniref:Uncharacterized protein n=1 Tax=Selenomonas sputigena TaxID=69823 RepID=A0ABV3X4Q4_9FIRM